MRMKSGRLDEMRLAAERLREAAGRWGLSLRDAGKLLGLSSLYLSAILIGIACRQIELLQSNATSRARR